MYKNLVLPLTGGETQPYVIKVWEEREKYLKRIYMQEFATVHNLKLEISGEPSLNDYKNAQKQIETVQHVHTKSSNVPIRTKLEKRQAKEAKEAEAKELKKRFSQSVEGTELQSLAMMKKLNEFSDTVLLPKTAEPD